MKILIPVDGSALADAAVAFVAARGALVGSQPEVELLNVQLAMPARAARMAGRAMVRTYYEAESRAALRKAESTLRRAGLAARSRTVVGHPGTEVAAAAADPSIHLVVMGSRGRTALKGLLFGSVTQAVLAATDKPLLVLRAPVSASRASLAVGIAVDGSRYGIAAVRWVLRHREMLGAAPRIELIHVVPDLAAAAAPAFASAVAQPLAPERLLAAQQAAWSEALAPAADRLRAGGIDPAEVRLSGPQAGDAIAAYARRARLDLLVMGSHGHGAFKAALLGSVATRVAARCTTPLLLIRKP